MLGILAEYPLMGNGIGGDRERLLDEFEDCTLFFFFFGNDASNSESALHFLLC